MARLDDLAAEVKDAVLRKQLQDAIAASKRKRRFGLVFEEHVPETVALPGLSILAASIVQRRSDPGGTLYRVTNANHRKTVTIEPLDGGAAEEVPRADLLVVKRFGEPIYPVLTPIGRIGRGPAGAPHHAVINGENFHALQLFVYLYEGRVDCIYIDPPFNTGSRDWKYNNRYVDKNDAWRHSKWLSMMEKRLRLAKRLLRPDGVLICSIDEHELNHLGLLLERLFPEYLRYMITVVINPKGRDRLNFAPVDECAFFLVPNTGTDIIARAPTRTERQPSLFEHEAEQDETTDADSDTLDQAEEREIVVDDGDEETAAEIDWEYRHARRRGGGAESSSYRERRPNQFYPIYIDETSRTVVRAGKSIAVDAVPSTRRVDGLRPLWPIDSEGRHRVWAFKSESMQRLIDAGNVVLGRYHRTRDDWTVKYRVPRKTSRKLKTVWWEKAYDAGTHGTELLKRFLGRPGLFPFPKSVYAIKDLIAAVVRERPNALILDFFAGSGTTFHATCLLNAELGGNRRSILVTNNEVAEKLANQLNRKQLFRGDPGFEEHGIYCEVTKPRCEAVLAGKRPDGTPVRGKHIDSSGGKNGRPLSQGFSENLEFFRIDYLDPDDVDLGHQFNAILPALWLSSGGIGKREVGVSRDGYSIPECSTYGILFRESRFRQFRAAIEARPEITHVWLVTDSEEAFAEMSSSLRKNLSVSMLYRDYLQNFRINTRQDL